MRPLRLCLAFLALLPLATVAHAVETAPAGVLETAPLALTLSPANAGPSEVSCAVPRGSIWQTAEEERFVALCSGEVLVPAHGSATMTIPMAALSLATVWKPGATLTPTKGREPRLEPLLAWVATRTDIPCETIQLAVFALTGNIGFAEWQKFLAATRRQPPATPDADVAGALDALTILRAVAPAGDFALASDGALKLRALHDPLLRARALQLYGLVVPGDAPPGGVAPDLSQLLHTKPGDNCPICRLREQMQKPAELP